MNAARSVGTMVSAVILGTLSLGVRPAAAQSTFFQGVANGCFYLSSASACTPGTTPTTVTTGAQGWVGAGLQYTGSSFGPTGPGTVSFGTFSLLPVLYDNLFNDAFVLSVMFTEPTVANATFLAQIYGSVIFANGYAYIDFGNSPATFGDAGQYSVWVDDIQLGEGIAGAVAPQSAALVGHVGLSGGAGTVTPEPASLLLLATGLFGMGGALFRRKRSRSPAA